MTKSVVDTLRDRASLYEKIRAFFSRLGHLEVDTPFLGTSTNTDANIHSVSASANGQRLFLQTSPEFYMKRLLAQDSGSIFQICHAFRDGERGTRHRAEFTLLEWYSLGLDYRQLMDQVEALVDSLLGNPQVFQRLRYFDCFKQQLGLDLAVASTDECRACVEHNIEGIDVLPLERDDCLDLLISQVISKQFQGFTFVYDYPASQASLAKINADNSLVAERFELFYQDLELANGFTELVDAKEQQQRFEQDNRLRQQRGQERYPIDEGLLQALHTGLPDCAGVALGLERLMMVIHDLDTIDACYAFNG